MEFIEANPLPIQCQRCVEQYCDECDYLALRFPLTEASQLILSQKIAEKKHLLELKREQIRKQHKRH